MSWRHVLFMVSMTLLFAVLLGISNQLIGFEYTALAAFAALIAQSIARI